MASTILAFTLVTVLCDEPPKRPHLRPENWAVQVISENLQNWYKVDDRLYRSEQPDEKGFLELETFGIQEVLNLRDNHSDDDEAEATSLVLHRIEMEADDITPDQIAQALRIIRKSKGPVLVHCWHGSDRTGGVVAFYRLIFQDWSKEEALSELRYGGYGFHEQFEEIVELIQDADLEDMKKKVKE